MRKQSNPILYDNFGICINMIYIIVYMARDVIFMKLLLFVFRNILIQLKVRHIMDIFIQLKVAQIEDILKHVKVECMMVYLAVQSVKEKSKRKAGKEVIYIKVKMLSYIYKRKAVKRIYKRKE
eukprot:227909_1